MDRKLKQKLDQYAVPDHSEKALEETIYRARELTAWISRTGDGRMTMSQFFFDQCRFVRPHTWLLKAGLALLMAVWLPGSISGSEIWFWTVVSLAGPLLCLINANDLGGFFQPGIIEIQMTAKYSCVSVDDRLRHSGSMAGAPVQYGPLSSDVHGMHGDLPEGQGREHAVLLRGMGSAACRRASGCAVHGMAGL